MRYLSPRELYDGNLEGGLLYWGPRRICQGSGKGSLFSLLLGNTGGRSFPRAFEGRKKFILFREFFMRKFGDM
jgi:hypothetical protein